MTQPEGGVAVQIKRCHGLGNIFCLLPVLDGLIIRGHEVAVQTDAGWVGVFRQLRPRIRWTAEMLPDAHDLDRETDCLHPQEHRTDEFGRLLGMGGPWPPLTLAAPPAWRRPFADLAGCVVFAPEGGHPSRCWPSEQARQLRSYLGAERLVLVGTQAEPPIPAEVDTRGRLSVEELIGVLSVARAVITMDSAVLHIAAGLGKPTVALFGGIDPRFRVRPEQSVVALQADLDCCPCNKGETCAGAYPCIGTVAPEQVAEALAEAGRIDRRQIRRISCEFASV